MVEIETNIPLDKIFSEKTVNEALGQRMDSFLAKTGLSISSVEGFHKDISAVTNTVYGVKLTNIEGVEMESILKVSQKRSEPRELALSNDVGGWNKNKLENESKILALVQNAGIPSPRPIFYWKFDDGMEVFAETLVAGQKCVNLRTPNVSPLEFGKLETEKGKILARLNNIILPFETFGTLDREAKRFNTWPDYFLTKVTTTLSCLYGMYDKLTNLQFFGNLVNNHSEWELFVENMAKLYSAETVLHLINSDGVPTLSHGDFWDGNLIANRNKDNWDVSVIDFERGGVEGKSFDLSLWLAWKVGGKQDNPNPIEASETFLKGYKEAGGTISPDIDKYVAIYGLWQYLDFLVMDTIYGIDRTDESIHEIKKFYAKIGKFI